MRQEIAQGRNRERLLGVLWSEAAAVIAEVRTGTLPLRTITAQYGSAVRIGKRALVPSLGVLLLLTALALSAAFDTSYALKIVLLISFALSFSLWASQDIVPEERIDASVLHEQIGFGIATMILAVSVAGSFIMRQANFWLIGALASLILLKSLCIAYRRGSLSAKI